MKWVDRTPIEGMLYREPEVVIFDLDRAAHLDGASGSALTRIWRWLMADLRLHVYSSQACAAQPWQSGPADEDAAMPRSTHHRPSARAH